MMLKQFSKLVYIYICIKFVVCECFKLKVLNSFRRRESNIKKKYNNK
jgi:hypothetical protein